VTMEADWIAALEAEVEAKLETADVDYETPLLLAQALDSAFVARDHLRHLSDRLAQAVRDVEAGRSRYLLVSMPPRLGKSQMTSIEFLTWLLHRHPDWPIMVLSHDPGLASNWGRAVRRRVEEHPELGLAIAPDAGAVTDWETTEGGNVLSKSIRQSVTGRGAKVMILDDVVKDFADAHSDKSREFIWDWWTSNSRTRLHPPALVIVIGTRWHEDDIIGRMRSPEYDGDPDQWEVISFPAIAEELVIDPHSGEVMDVVDARVRAGEDGDVDSWDRVPDALGRAPGEPLLSPLIPDETPEQAVERWEDIRRSVGTYAWNALFQQRPQPSSGSIFDVDWWRYWRPGDWDDPEQFFDRRITDWDCAFKGADDSDFVVGAEWGVRGADRYLIRMVRKRMTFTETVAKMKDFILGPVVAHRPDDPGQQALWDADPLVWLAAERGMDSVDGYTVRTEHGAPVVRGPHSGVHEHVVEDKANGTAVIDTLRREIPGMVPWSPGQDSKEGRARAVSPQVEAGNVLLPALADWLPDYLSEMKAFPNGTNDDQVDMTSMALLRLRDGGGVTPLVPGGGVQRQQAGAGKVGPRGGMPALHRGGRAQAVNPRGRGMARRPR
jgi:predicted phage terminase large subunit-like protein